MSPQKKREAKDSSAPLGYLVRVGDHALSEQDFQTLIRDILRTRPGDAGPDSRGIGTWLIGEGPTGPGIRPTPYRC